MRLSDTENTIITGMARAFFVSAYAAKQEERQANHKPYRSPGPGGEWMDFAPATPKYVRDFALMFAGGIRGGSLLVLLNNAAWADVLESHGVPNHARHSHREWETEVEELKTDEYCRLFGHYLAMQGTGSGVSWFDDHAHFDIEVPHTEAYLD